MLVTLCNYFLPGLIFYYHRVKTSVKANLDQLCYITSQERWINGVIFYWSETILLSAIKMHDSYEQGENEQPKNNFTFFHFVLSVSNKYNAIASINLIYIVQ